MVKIISVTEHKNQSGDYFRVVNVVNEVQLVKSKEGNFRFDSAKAGIPSALPLEVLEELIGTTLPGTIIKKPCEPFTFISREGEEITLDYRWVYSEE